jgi:hypothetical protein
MEDTESLDSFLSEEYQEEKLREIGKPGIKLGSTPQEKSKVYLGNDYFFQSFNSKDYHERDIMKEKAEEYRDIISQ